MQSYAAAGGIVGEQFWEVTMDEVEHAVYGWVLTERNRRNAAFFSSMNLKKGTRPTDLWGLPFDEELEQEPDYDIEKFYHDNIGGLN